MTAKSDLAEAVARAKREREHLQEKIQELSNKVQEINGFLGYVDKHLIEHVQKKVNDNIELPIQDHIPTDKDAYKKMSVSKVAESVLRENGSPMQVKDMASLLWEAGYRRYDKRDRLYTTLYTTMTRRKGFYRLKEEGAVFGLVEWQDK